MTGLDQLASLAARGVAGPEVREHALSHNQRSLWFIAQESPASSAYNMVIALRIAGPIAVDTLRGALQGLIDRHATLRTTYHLGPDGLPLQRTVGFAPLAFSVHDAAGLSDDALSQRIEAECRRPIDLERGPIFSAALYTRGENEHVLVMVVHHIAADGWSAGILSRDLFGLYAEATRDGASLPAVAKEYVDFVDWQDDMLGSEMGRGLAQAWQARLQGVAPIALPGDRPRPAQKAFRGATLSATLDARLTKALRTTAREHAVTLYVVLLAALDAMLFRITGSGDLVVGSPTSGRTRPEFKDVVGNFANPVPVRTTVQAGMTYRALLERVRDDVRDALDRQDYPLSLMVQQLQGRRDPSRSPLFETFFTFLPAANLSLGMTGQNLTHTVEPFPLRQLEGQFDLSLLVRDQGATLALELGYKPDIFDESTAEGFRGHYLELLEAVARDSNVPVEALRATAPTPAADSIEAFLAALAARDIRIVLDGERLRLNAPAGAVDAGLKASLAQRKQEIIEALRAGARSPHGLRPRPRTGNVPISFAQQRLWFFDRIHAGSAHYNISLPLRLLGLLDQRALTRALDALVRRHEPLRTCIREVDGQPRAEIRDYAGTAVHFMDLTGLPATEREPEVLRLFVERGREPFDLARGPMARFVLMRVADDDHRLLLCLHHIAADGWSLSVAAREIAVIYEAELTGQPAMLPPLVIHYADYAAWQRDQLNSGLLARQLSYWQGELEGAPAVLELPVDSPRPAVQSYRGRRRSRSMSPALLDALKAFSRAHDATLFMTLLAGWQVLLSRCSGQDDILVGSTLANRDQPELESLVGCFVNNVVLRGRLEDNPTFGDFLQRTKATVLRAFDHRDLPFDRLVEALRPERNTSHHPIFQTLLTLHSFPLPAADVAGLRVEVVDSGEGEASARFDLTLEMDETGGGLRMVYEYATDLFERATIERLHGRYMALLEAVVGDAGRAVRDLPILTADDVALLDAINATGVEHDRSHCAHHLVEAVARQMPDGVAVEAEDATLTYAELDARANRLAHLLRAQGVGSGSLVGVCLDRTSFLPVALVAVHKAGAAYVPVDPSHPADRLSYTLRDAQVCCVVTESRFSPQVAAAAVPLVFVDDPSWLSAEATPAPDVTVDPSDLAYVIYTSGSTGRPKGVEIEHRHLVNLLRAMQREPGMQRADVLLAVTTPSFDIAGLEMFLPLVTGARLVIASRGEVLDGERLYQRMTACGATVMQATPATWRLMIDAGWEGKTGLTALCGGEALPRDLAGALAPRVGTLWNVYGPTETTIWSTGQEVTDWERDIPIGRPIMNTSVYIVDPAGRQVPPGVAGELWIGGEGVARGYHAAPALTAEKFVDFAPAGRDAERVYRTGDVVRLRGDLTLEFVGRRDHQVKVRGHRIELGEIESVLTRHPAVRRSVVIVREDTPGDQRLVAYVVAQAGAAIDDEALRTLLRTKLPEYMVPSTIVTLEVLPLTPNGKIDRKALPVPRLIRAGQSSGPDVLMSETERQVAAIWCDVLKLDRVGLRDNFFDLGGHSLLVIKVHAELRRRALRDIAVIDLFQRTTVQAQAELLAPADDRDGGVPRAQARLARHGVR